MRKFSALPFRTAEMLRRRSASAGKWPINGKILELIALSAITCPAKLCETCQKNFPPFFDVKIEEIML
ncbi:MAG: hypothetical protein CW346_16560 [Bacillaceae bacterium]|nr:hypothetical protein [Bacillaceae bacterium]